MFLYIVTLSIFGRKRGTDEGILEQGALRNFSQTSGFCLLLFFTTLFTTKNTLSVFFVKP